MTDHQLKYLALQEDIRHNQATEAAKMAELDNEKARIAEVTRSNLAQESIQDRKQDQAETWAFTDRFVDWSVNWGRIIAGMVPFSSAGSSSSNTGKTKTETWQETKYIDF